MISRQSEQTTIMDALGAKRAGRRVGELFEAHARSVLGLCRLILRDPAEAEDAAQQTFLSAHRALLRGTEPREPEAWLAQIARNECRTHLRRRQFAAVPLDGVPDPSDARDASEVAADRERLHAVTSAIEELPDRQRQAVVLRDLRGLSNDEVAQALSVPTGTVEALVYRGRHRVRAAFRRGWPVPVLVPVSLRDALARLIPGFEAPSGAAGAGVAALGAKVLAAPLAKVAAGVAAAVMAAGATAVEIEHAVVKPSRGPARHAAAQRVAVDVIRAAPVRVAVRHEPIAHEARGRSTSRGHGSGSTESHRGHGGHQSDEPESTSTSGHDATESTSGAGPGTPSQPAPSAPVPSPTSGSSGPGPAPSTEPVVESNSGPGSTGSPEQAPQVGSSGPSVEVDSSGPSPDSSDSDSSGSDSSGSGSDSSGSGSDSSGSGSGSSGSDSSGPG